MGNQKFTGKHVSFTQNYVSKSNTGLQLIFTKQQALKLISELANQAISEDEIVVMIFGDIEDRID